MLKLGDKQIMGVVLPTLIFGVLFFVPWIDQNPHRLPSRRKAALAIGSIFVVLMVILTYMGTPGFGIETPPAQDILSEFVPATHPGPVRELPWDEVQAMPDGTAKTYFVSFPEAWETDPRYAGSPQYEFVSALSLETPDEWHEVLRDLKAKVENAPKLIPPVHGDQALAKVTVEQLQPNLKWAVFTITWDELVLDDTGKPTERIRYDQAKIDARTGEAVLDDNGVPVTVPAQVEIFRDAEGEPYVEMPSTKEIVYIDGSTVSWPTDYVNAAGEVVHGDLELSMSDIEPNLKRSTQEAKVALDKNSNYR
jgi:hypothetical protein